jgi:O-antigen/teichoic acid export membrane protein
MSSPAVRSDARAERRRHGSVLGLASTNYALALLGLVTGPLVARSLGPIGRGEFAAVATYSGFAVAVVGLGIPRGINYALQTLKIAPGVVLGTALRFCALVFIPAAALGILVAATIMDRFSGTAQLGALVLTALAPLGVLQLSANAFLMTEGALGVLTRVQAAPLLINAVAVIGLAVAGELTLLTYLIATLVSLIVPMLMALRGLRVRPARGGHLSTQLQFGLRAYPGSLASLANGRLDQALIGPFLGAADLGFYAIAVSLSSLPLSLAQAVAARGISQVTRPEGGLDPELAGRVIRRGAVMTALMSLAVAAVLPIFIPIVYGSDFTRSLPLALVLLIGTLALGVTVSTSFCLNLAGRPGATSIAEIISVVVTAVGLLVLLPTLGVLAAALVSAVAYWTRAAWHIRSLRQVGVERFMPRGEDIRLAIQLVRERVPLPSALRRLTRRAAGSSTRGRRF